VHSVLWGGQGTTPTACLHDAVAHITCSSVRTTMRELQPT